MLDLIKKLVMLGVPVMITACATSQVINDIGVSSEATSANYTKDHGTLGTVLLDVRWARQWGCGKFENAQLISFGFDRMPLTGRANEDPPDVLIGTTQSLAANEKFESLALLVPPGEYALSQFKIRVTKSASRVDFWVANRSDTIKDAMPYAGKFKVAAGETVYIGNFALDCYQQPSLWRYYSEGKDGFKQQLADYKKKYPFLDLRAAKYRLLETTVIGRPYELR